MAITAKIELQNKDKAGNQKEASVAVDPAKAAKAIQTKSAGAPRSVFSRGKGRRPRAINGRAQGKGLSCFSGAGPKDGSGPLGGTELCPLN